MNTATVHVYYEPMQPATRFIDSHFDPPITFICSPGRLLRVHCCWKLRQARNCVVQVYYDGRQDWCAPGKGCKHPREVGRVERQRWQRRSAGQKRRWATKKKERRDSHDAR